jgi:hypothetical protein
MWVVAIFTIVAIILTIKPVAQSVTKGLSSLTNNALSIPVEMFQNVAAQMAWLGFGVMLFLLVPLIAVVSLKYALMLSVGVLIGYSIYSLYNSLVKKKVDNTLPSEMI